MGGKMTKIQEIAEHYGRDKQLHQTMEECAELSVECSHTLRGKGNRNNLAGEIADVMIMLRQILYLEDIPEEDVETIIEFKLDRQMSRIRDEELRWRLK